jgi:hypothetical protein
MRPPDTPETLAPFVTCSAILLSLPILSPQSAGGNRQFQPTHSVPALPSGPFAQKSTGFTGLFA